MKVNGFVRLVNGFLLLLLVTSLLTVSSCKKKETQDPEPTGEVTNEEINKWVLDSMNYWYFWNKSIPSASNLNFNVEPPVFFDRLLKQPEDRFSWIQNAQELEEQLSGVIKTSGLGYSFFRIDLQGGNVIAGLAVRYVHKGSPADLAGIKRGDVFIELNDGYMPVDADGYVQNIEPLRGNDPFTLTKAVFNDAGDIVNTGEQIQLTPVEGFQEKAIHLDSILITDNGTKVAYLFYNRFLQQQAQDLVDVFKKFKDAGVTELIVDERYNSGGSVGIAGLLSALIHKNFNISSEFIRYQFNDDLGTLNLTYADMFGATNANLVNSLNLGLDRVFILATGSSASASELLINNLRPFMGDANVIHIGGVTTGKDEASITISNSSSRFKDETDWGIQPIVLKYRNRDGVGDFVAGLTPTYSVQERVPYAPMGSSDDPLIARALGIIDPSMQAALNRQMSIRGARAVPPSSLLEAFNKGLSDPRPLDVTESLKGIPLKLN